MPHDFSRRLIKWQKQYGRHNLPWQTDDAYRIWLSEIMLQQTQVATVLDYYPRFLAAFPDVASLAAAPQDEVLNLWAGLGYYSRARNLHKAAKQIIGEFGGLFPDTRQELETLCGVGRSTAAAIAAFAFKRRETILDGNVKRVLCRVFARDGDPSDRTFERGLWDLAESLMPPENADMPAYTQGLMDLGATVCKRSSPSCTTCPMQNICQALKQNRVHELPRKKTAAAVQNLTVFWLLLSDAEGRILLHKRPQKGIWGGLYCLPSFDSLSRLHQAAATFGIEPEQLSERPALSHRLTHRLLEILPFAARSDHRIPSAILPECADGIWVAGRELSLYGLPKPLSSLLSEVQNTLF